ncbi:MAG: MBL fold metallo-hydrolase [Sphaerospermopsis sp. SIO1G2]|nr:MBL fold metallo-hydrolase [Sphaerospermopsis sp. SIO1G2]
MSSQKRSTALPTTNTLISRRRMLKLSGASALAAFLAACQSAEQAPAATAVPSEPEPEPVEPTAESQTQTMGNLTAVDMPDFAGSVMVADRGLAKVHTYIAPADANANATHIIESENALVIIDGQMLVPFATEFRTYVDSLGKPIERLYLSHSHPDHHWGIAAAFSDVPVFALAETISAIEAGGQGMLDSNKPQMGDLLPETVHIPDNTVTPGEETIDGILYDIKHVKDAEDTDQLVIKLPELKTIVLQDLIYSDIHLFVAANLESWGNHVGDMQALDEFTLGLGGHGLPFESPARYDEVRAYLQSAGELIGSVESAADYVSGISEAYPEYEGTLHELSASILFSG